MIIQDVSQDWAEILRSEYPKFVHSTFLAEHMIRLDGLSTNDVALEQLRKDLSSSCPDTKMYVDRPTNGRSIVDFDFPFRPSTHMGLHVDFLFETIDMERVPSNFSFSGGPRRNVFEKDASNRLYVNPCQALLWFLFTDTCHGARRSIALMLNLC